MPGFKGPHGISVSRWRSLPPMRQCQMWRRGLLPSSLVPSTGGPGNSDTFQFWHFPIDPVHLHCLTGLACSDIFFAFFLHNLSLFFALPWSMFLHCDVQRWCCALMRKVGKLLTFFQAQQEEKVYFQYISLCKRDHGPFSLVPRKVLWSKKTEKERENYFNAQETGLTWQINCLTFNTRKTEVPMFSKATWICRIT